MEALAIYFLTTAFSLNYNYNYFYNYFLTT